MQNDLRKLVNSVKDENIKSQLKELENVYSLILDSIKEDNDSYRNVKKLEEYYIPSIVRHTNSYLELTGNETYINRELEKFKNNILESIFNSKMACRTILQEMQEADIMKANAEIQANKICMELEGMYDSFFMTPSNSVVKEEVFQYSAVQENNHDVRVLSQDPFIRPNEREKSQLKAGYKYKYNLAYEYIDDYYPMCAVSNNIFSTVIDDIEINRPRASKEVADMLKKVLKDVNICILPGIAFYGLKAAVLEIDGANGINLSQALKVDFSNKNIYIDDELSVKGKDFVLLTSVCKSGREFSMCKKFLQNAGAKSVRCLALAREIDYFPEEKR